MLTRRVSIDSGGVIVALGHVLLRADRSRYLCKRTVETAAPERRRRGYSGSSRRRLAAMTPRDTNMRRPD